MIARPLLIEMTFLNLISDWLEDIGWAEILVKSNVGAPGRGESNLNGSHCKGSRYGHQDTCVSLTILMKKAYQKANYDGDFSSWIAKGKDKSVLSLSWNIVLELATMFLTFLKSTFISD